MRQQRSLAGRWRFQLDPEGTLQLDQLQPDREITVPLPWQAALPELRRYSGYAWYQRSFDVDAAWLEGEILLRFGAVDYLCEVYVNGQRVGEHEGGFTAFEFKIRGFVHEGENTLAVRVYDAAQQGIVTPRWRDEMPGAQLPPTPEDMPQGKQNWYVDVSGIWQDVTLTAVPAAHIGSVRIVTDIHTNEARVSVEVVGEASALSVAVGEASAAATITPGQSSYELTISIPDVTRWTPDTPHLYTAVISLNDADQLEVRFGFREISKRDGKLLLNGEPIMLLCALDQDFYEDTIYTPPSEEYLRDEFAKAKALGLNSLRCHIKPPDPLYLELADEMGLLIWAEIPSWRSFQPKTQVYAPVIDPALDARLRVTLAEMIQRDFNHPSLIIWTIVNEDWGTLLGLRPEDRKWVAEMYDLCKRLDPTRLVVDNSPCGAPWGTGPHVKTDLNDYHIYYNIPDHADSFADFIEQFSLRPAWLFSQTGDASQTGDEPLILSEFGNWGLPTLEAIGERDWFDLGPWWSSWGGDAGFPQGAAERFQRYGLNNIWEDFDAFAEASQWHQYAALKFEIETMRRCSGIEGYVITELSDIYWESNGLLDFARGTKVYHDVFSHINAEDVVVPEVRRTAYWDSEALTAQLHLSHYSGEDWNGAQFSARFGEDVFTDPIPALARGEVRKLDDFDWRMPQSTQLQLQYLDVEVTGSTGKLLAQSHTPILVLPSEYRRAEYSEPIGFAGSLRDDLVRLGYQVEGGKLCVADRVDAPLLDWVAEGNDLLLLSESGNPFVQQQGRGGTYSGDWMTCFSWLRPSVYKRLDGVTNPLSMPFRDMMPHSVLVGLPVENSAYHGDFLAGQITGWIGHPALHTVQFRWGKGRVILTTYPLKNALSSHPLAVAMLHDLIDYLASDACQPTLVLKA